ncbi:hypothetical protein TVAG_158330 [Trichomonas vaginalis G3]|uniref:Uncharacterized protein n=1 Tax=Trichomonas vaginalis (strain ATCC PRA-98 / G3) TaxID=412133 RepID=A2FP44_TRIV3|nr:hypothetical protein TVAGG3_0500580 [Trichomonas vaginalis G3]EAX93314.1 hypothetical protein TVAG_158330 [Trichomonas vaginalis G3]KAI5517047.1 hypothetical protein TVAGG3_0500580 [Trichomonas vaginalis G3]|eukprot:XP_001306244.1 hypothetical protein [Trichomonas vaginalis G3]
MNTYIQERKEILPNKELEEMREFVDGAKSEEFKIFDPRTQKMVPYDEKVLRRLSIHIRNQFFEPHFGAQILGVFCDCFDDNHLWYVHILSGLE